MSIRRDTLYNLGGQVIPLVVTLLTLPSYLQLIGDGRYGVLAIAWALLGYFGLFDLGLSRATAQRIASLHDAGGNQRSRTLWTAVVTVALLGLAASPMLWTGGAALIDLLPIGDTHLQAELLAALPWLVVALPVSLVAGVLSGALQGRQRFLALNLVQSIAASLAMILPLLVAALGFTTLAWLVAATLLPRVLTAMIMLRLCRVSVPLARWPTLDLTDLRALAGFGGWISLAGVVSPLLAAADRLVIGAFSGPAAVTSYTVPQGLVSRGAILAGALASTLFPRFACRDFPTREQIMQSALLALALVMTPLVFLGLWLVEPLLHLWLGEELAGPMVPVAQILLVGLWMNTLAHIPLARLLGEGKPRTVALLYLAELVPYGLLLALLLSLWGIVGAALAWTLRVGADTVVMTLLTDPELQPLARLLVPGCLLAGAAVVVVLVPVAHPAHWLLAGILAALLLLWMTRAGLLLVGGRRPHRFAI